MRAYLRKYDTHVHKHIHTYIHKRTYIHACNYARTYVCVCTCVIARMRTYKHMYVLASVYIYNIYIYTHACIIKSHVIISHLD